MFKVGNGSPLTRFVVGAPGVSQVRGNAAHRSPFLWVVEDFQHNNIVVMGVIS